VIGTVTLLKFGAFSSKFSKETRINNDLKLYGLRFVSCSWDLETLDGDAVRSSGIEMRYRK
jgi:hypothetical protein